MDGESKPQGVSVGELFNGCPRFMRAADFVGLKISTPAYLVAPFFPTGGVAVLFGRGASGKTQLALTMAVAVLEGGMFLSRYKARKGKVVMVEVDTPPLVMQKRLATISKRHDISELGLVMYDSAVDVVGLARRIGTGAEPPDWVKAIRESRPDLVIVDSLRKTHDEDENDSRTPALVLRAWRYLLPPGTAILFIHHARKVPVEFSYADDDGGARGSSAWMDDVDVQMQMINSGGNNRLVKWTKVRTCEEEQVPPVAVAIDSESLLVRLQDKAASRAVELAAVGLDRGEIVKQLVKEGLCSQSLAYKRADEAMELLGKTQELD